MSWCDDITMAVAVCEIIIFIVTSAEYVLMIRH